MAVLKPKRPGRSEMSHGKGRYVDPRSDYQSQRKLPFPVETDKRAASLQREAELRLDPTNPLELVNDMYYVNGNADFYPGEPLVQEPVQVAPSVYKQPIWRYGVDRQA